MSCVARVVGGAGERIRIPVHRTPPGGCWVGGRGRGVLSDAIEWGLGLEGACPCPVLDVPGLRVCQCPVGPGLSYADRSPLFVCVFPVRTNIQYTLYTIQCILNSIYYTVYTIQYTLYSVHYTVYYIQYKPYSIHYTVYTIQYWYSISCSLRCVGCGTVYRKTERKTVFQ